jgi:pSer/pThr/pTyr-binding forkhead associated (FHA) protein
MDDMTVTPIDSRTLAQAPTEALDALDRPSGERHATPATPPAPGRYLLVEDGAAQRQVQLTRAITHIGRGFAATIQLEDQSVSRRHAIVTQRRGTVRILDDRSSNGTFVNGRRIAEAELRDGDVIVLGRVVLVFRELAG